MQNFPIFDDEMVFPVLNRYWMRIFLIFISCLERKCIFDANLRHPFTTTAHWLGRLRRGGDQLRLLILFIYSFIPFLYLIPL